MPCCRSTTRQAAVEAVEPGQPRGEPVEQLQRVGGGAALQQRRRQRAAQLAHDRRGGRALADDVAHGDGHPVLVELDQVVPVAAGAGALGARHVPRGQRQPVDRGQRLGEQAALQRLGDPLLRAVEPGAVQRLCALLGQRQEHLPLGRQQPPGRAPAERHDTDRAAGRDQRDGHVARMPMLVIAVGDVGEPCTSGSSPPAGPRSTAAAARRPPR